MLRGIVRVTQIRTARQIAFKLDPVQPLNVLMRIRFHESVQFTICDAVEYPAICSDILSGLRQFNSYCRIAFRSDHVAHDFALRRRSLGRERDATDKRQYEHNNGSKQGSPQT